MSNTEWLNNVNVGDRITAKLLTNITQAVNRNTKAVQSPRQIIEPDAGNETSPEANITPAGDEVFDSTGGVETTVTATDSNGDTVDIERVDTITFAEQTSGRSLTLNITYPL